MAYTKDDLVQLSWKEFDNYILKIKQDLEKFLKQNNLKIDIIAPILRGGGIPGVRLAFHFNVVRMLPFQYKYIYKNKSPKPIKVLETNISQLKDFKSKEPTILVVEGNHSTGTVASNIVQELKKQLPSATILYVALAKDYFYKDSVKDTNFTTCGFFSNENKKLSEKECKELDIEPNKAFIFPWENPEEELAGLNQEDFQI